MSPVRKILTNAVKHQKLNNNLDDILEGLMILLIQKEIIRDKEEFLELIDSIKLANYLDKKE